MRSSRLAAAGGVLLAGMIAAACGSAEGPGWTYQPAASVTPAPSGAASGEPSGSAAASGSATASGSAAASGGAEPSGSPAASGSAAASGGAEPGDGETVQVVAVNAAGWETPELTAPADTAFTLEFDNQDPAAPHNVVIQNPDGSKVDMGDTSFFTGPEVRTYEVPALSAGDYPFICEVHPQTMVGTLTAE